MEVRAATTCTARSEANDSVVADTGHAPIAEINGRQRLQHVVELITSELHGDRLVACDAAQVFEISHAGLVYDDARDAQRRSISRDCP